MSRDARNRPGTRRGRDAATFSYLYPLSFTLSVPRAIIPQPGYPENPQTLGQHIKKRRMDLDLLQREVADRIGVNKDSIYNWERGVEPELRFIPNIVAFLGHVPFPQPMDPLGRLAYYKRVHGLSYEGLATRVHIHHEQLQAWFTGRTRPSRKSLCRIEAFLKS